MAEKEVKEAKKEKAKINISIWFILFIIYLIFSLAFILKQNNTIEALNTEIATLNTKIESNLELSNTRTNAIIIQLENIIKDLRDTNVVENETPVVTPSVEVSMGTYTGSTNTMQMTLTLSENNIASVSTNESGDLVVNGTYVVAVDTVVFTSDDGATTYNFTANVDGTLKLVNSELTLSK